jgi:catechol 2,3-dioxygenase-like lactoylglutathione lyase family enzyme
MRFGYTILYVGDVAGSVDFYERAFGLERRLLHESGRYAELETGATALAFAARDLAAENVPGVLLAGEPDESPPRFEVCFVTEDVAGAFERAVQAGAAPVSAPRTRPWQQDVAYVRDPDGTLVELANPVGG